MPLWQAADSNTSAPKFAVFGGLDVAANGNVLFDNVQVNAFATDVALGVFGVSAGEVANTQGEGFRVTHSGWVNRKQGTGPVTGIIITNGGSGYANGFLTISGGGASNTPANASFTVNGSGGIVTVTLVSGGSDYISAPNVTVANANSQATFTSTVGGRAGRIFMETLVATGTIGPDAGADDAQFPGP